MKQKGDGKKRENSRKIEILAPAGSMEGLRAAIGAGADAVYMGGSRFGARAFADNPDTDGMLSAIDYAHFYGRSLYMTVNTLLKPEEMGDELYRYLKPYYEAGLDAVIVQDAGVVEFVSREFPGLPIHVSTQMSLTAAEGARSFRDYPVTRIVPARELGLDELKRLRASTKLEIETFVHGALCYCYSGQCLMSSMLGGRSGNRGRCAQPCRMEYGVRETKDARSGCGTADGSYLLSPKDMCTLDMIPELIEAGIDSFKIEGRMKRPEYAAGVAAAYRAEADRYFELGAERYAAFHRDHPEVLRQELLDMQDLYNRGGFSNGYYRQHNGRAMMSMRRPNHSGVRAAKVLEVRKNSAVLCASEELNAQDILEIRLSGGGVYEFTLKDAKRRGEQFAANFLPGLRVKPGDSVFRTRNNRLLEGISERWCERRPVREIVGCLEAKIGEPLRLSVMPAGEERQGEEWPVTVSGDPVERAQKQPMTEERLRAQLEKTGDTPFRFAELEIRCSEPVFIPLAKLNELRREALCCLEKEICGRYRREEIPEAAGSRKNGAESVGAEEGITGNDRTAGCRNGKNGQNGESIAAVCTGSEPDYSG
ncbi:MAG: U32 family peptidase, partial [Lachnospiraceae bacterium]|nr:U32 family peptidase [Lachnospiraceae bacterium]